MTAEHKLTRSHSVANLTSSIWSSFGLTEVDFRSTDTLGVVETRLPALPPLQFRKALSLTLYRAIRSCFEQRRSLHRGSDRAADNAVEPVVVATFGSQLPFVDGSPPTFGTDAELRREVLGQEAVRVGFVAEERQAATVANWRGKARVDERLPIVRIEDDVPDGSFALDVGDSPVVAHSVAGPAFVLGERLA